MAIYIDELQHIFHLQSRITSYVIQIVDGFPLLVYWGQRLSEKGNLAKLVPGLEKTELHAMPQEYPQYGTGDFRSPAYQVQLEDGSRITELRFKGYSVAAGKTALEDLPYVYTESVHEADTLELELEDAYSGMTVLLKYCIFVDGAITRSVQFKNNGASNIKLLRALSANVDLYGKSDYEFVYLAGHWAREAHLQRRPLGPGGTSLGSRRGMSSHQHNPFAAVVSPGTNEDHGEVFAVNLVYSGNFHAEAEVDAFGVVRLGIGLNPFDFCWVLPPGESFQTPEAVLVYSNEGIGGMSRIYHRLYRNRLCRGVHRDKERPILVNNWEATYFNFTADKIEAIAEAGSQLGIELLVLDDGWFGKRDSDNSSLGDWVEDRRKLPNGLRDLAERIERHGLQFGLWFEPEMISPDSDLYRKHPDWCLHVEGRRRTEARWQLVLDLSRPEVRDYVYDALAEIFTNVHVAYVKWDMNRALTEIGSATALPENQQEIAHRYVLGLYKLLDKLTTAFPEILFESCSSGGGRFDPGMLYYMPQTWTSDNTDAVERLKIQYGTSLVYPVSTIGAHVSAVPNHQVHRETPLKFRGDVAMSGNFGYELDLTKFTDAEKIQVKEQVAMYKEHRSLIQKGDLFRLRSPFQGNETSWMFVSDNQCEAIVFYFQVLAKPTPATDILHLKGLDHSYTYEVSGESGVMGSFGGDRLMQAGLIIPPLTGDYTSVWFKLSAIQ
ncbi:alpha-galactosidase [Paenibacillus xylanexedens]|uniref:alpha-galactosidase n=1 Tax=Paenibacillus xylanexedens TaxID=528191 RepID=UPI000F536B7A|nr:alpha-galactosidase [Paenibacillus xylanexedens]RPK31264.1 Alpha-galactosidase [Paenibacillus xylanexedens]